MNEIKIFIASSEELKHERQVFSDLALKLNLLLKENQVKINLEKWEYLDSSMGILKKQDEYNIVLKQCNICIALFWTKFGDFTGEEFQVAKAEAKLNNVLKEVHLYFKNDFANIEITKELLEFKEKCKNEELSSCSFDNDRNLTYLFITLIDKYCKEHFGFNIAKKENNKLMVEHKIFVDLDEITNKKD